MRFERDDGTLLISAESPTAIVRATNDADRVLSWPDLHVGYQHVSTRTFGSSTGVWAVHQPEESLVSATPAPGAAVHVGWDGTLLRVEDLGNRRPVGATREGLLLITAEMPDPDERAAWFEDPEAAYLTVDGALRTVTSDRRIAGAYEDDIGAHHLLYAGPPTTAHEFGGISYSYPLVAGELSTDDMLDSLHLHAQSAAVDEQLAFSVLGASYAPHVIDGAGLPKIPWAVIGLSERDARTATQAVVDEFRHLDTYWHADDGTSAPLAVGLADTRIDVFGEWPSTRVEVSFTHPHYRAGRLRRVLPVFDTAGRINPYLYASIQLMEDLDTGDLPNSSSARDSVLTI